MSAKQILWISTYVLLVYVWVGVMLSCHWLILQSHWPLFVKDVSILLVGAIFTVIAISVAMAILDWHDKRREEERQRERNSK